MGYPLIGLTDNSKGEEVTNRNNSRQNQYSQNAAYSVRSVSSSENTGGNPVTYNSEFSRQYYGKKNVKRPRKPHTGLKVFLGCFIVLLVAVIACAGVAWYYGNQLYQSALHVRTQANEAMDDLEAIKDDIIAGNTAAARQKAQNLSAKAKAMNEETDGDLWVLAEKIPTYGEDITTVRVLTDVFEDVCVNAIEPMCDQMSGISLSSLMGEDNTINVDQLTQLADSMSTVSPVLQRSAETFSKCPEPHIDQLKGIINKTANQLNSANELLEFANRFAPLIPDVLGANGKRDYLIVAQNNVESRATGGFFGSAGILTIENGHFEVNDFSRDVLPAGQGARDFGANPDFPHEAEHLYAYYENSSPLLDGIFLIDPIFIQHLTKLAGEFTASDGTELNGSNLAEVIMHDTYWRYVNDNAAQDVFFSMIANDTMHHVFSSFGDMDIKELAEMIFDDGKKRHLSIWFVDPEEEAAITELGCAGAVSYDPTEPIAGIYFVNESWSKMEWYLHTSKDIVSETENEDGSKTYDIELSLTNTISYDEANSGNWYITGDAVHGNYTVAYQAGDMLERVLLCAPAGGYIDNAWTDADVYDYSDGEMNGLDTRQYHIHLLPGETVTFYYSVTTSPEAKGDLAFDMTPLAETANDDSE